MRPAARLHYDERGTISILSVFGLLLMTMLLGMVMNVGRQVDNKVKMQQAADAAAYGGGVVLARSMNTLAFTNHLLCDVFALTAFMREGRDRHGEVFVPEILAAWKEVGEVLTTAKFEKFARLGPAIQQKAYDEQELVTSYGNWAAASSEAILPMLETILAEELIPQYQRALVATTPQLAQTAVNEIAKRHGLSLDGTMPEDRGPLQAMLWRTMGMPVHSEAEVLRRTLPVVDPVMDQVPNLEEYVLTSLAHRQSLAHTYLRMWNDETMAAIRLLGQMSQFATLWDGLTCGQLEKLLNENQNRNLLHVIRFDLTEDVRIEDGTLVARSDAERSASLESDYTFVAAAYWSKAPAYFPGVFRSPIEGDNVTYAQVMMFVPRNRLVRVWISYDTQTKPQGIPIGGVPGEFVELPPTGTGNEAPSGGSGGGAWIIARQGRPTAWDLLNQNWQVQLVPATSASLLTILRTPPTFDGMLQQAREVELPNMGDLTADDLSVLSHH